MRGFLRIVALALLLSQAQPWAPAPPTGAAGEPPPGDAARPAGRSPAGVRLPLAFEENAGQSAAAVRFLARLPAGRIFFTPSAIVLALATPADTRAVAGTLGPDATLDRPRPAVRGNPGAGGAAPTVVRVQWQGANPAPLVNGAQALPGRVNYLLGANPAHWHTAVPTYGGIRYAALYPGIDLRYTGAGGGLKGTYILAPGADPAAIRWRYQECGRRGLDGTPDCGSAGVTASLDAQGNLQIALTNSALSPQPSAFITEQAPVAWQDRDGQHMPVSVHYVVDADGSVGFALGPYDAGRTLTIDPTLTYSTFLGGTDSEEVAGIAAGVDGSTYITGFTSSVDFPLQDPIQGTDRGAVSAYVAHLSADGSTLLYSTYIGGTVGDWAFSITTDAAGDAYVTGLARSPDFPLHNPLQDTLDGDGDAFVLELNPAGSALVYSTYLGGGARDTATGIAVDAAGAAYVAGFTASPDFPVHGAVQPDFGGGATDSFVAKIAPAGAGVVYATYLGGSDDDSGGAEQTIGVAVDSAGSVYVTGSTESADFPLHGAIQTTVQGMNDVYVSKLSPDGSAFVYSTYLGGHLDDAGAAVAVDAAGNAYLTGLTNSSDFPTTASFQPAYGGGSYDAYVVKLPPDGSRLLYSTFLGGYFDDRGRSIAVDAAGNAFVAGYTDSSNFPSVRPVQAAYGGGSYDAFATRLNAAGSVPLFSTFLGGHDDDYYETIALDAAGVAHLGGASASLDWPLAGPAIQAALNGGIVFDAVITRISPQGPPAPPCADEFADVPPGAPYYAPVSYLVCLDVLSGYGDGTFRPGAPVTRGELAKIVVNSAGLGGQAIPPNAHTFADVPPTQPFWPYIERLARPGLISGYACGGPGEPCDGQHRPYFRPSANVTRGQLSKIVALAAGATAAPVGQRFEDVPPTQPFYAWIEPLADLQVISGYACGVLPAGPCIPPDSRPYFVPGNPVTRGQAAKIVANSFFPDYPPPSP